MEGFDEIIQNEISLKAKSKREIYNLLASSGGVYLPPMKDCNYKFIKELICGKKKVFLKI